MIGSSSGFAFLAASRKPDLAHSSNDIESSRLRDFHQIHELSYCRQDSLPAHLLSSPAQTPSE
jgi:hypothetical protein